MDPLPLTTAEWGDTGPAIIMLWLALVCAVVAGVSLVTAHAIIPSAVATRTISGRWEKLRPVFYLVGITAVLGIGIFLYLSTQYLDWIQRVWPRYWM
jgi:hypothetical protein